MSRAIYNEIDPYVCRWLRNLIDAEHISPGSVIERSIKELEPGSVSSAQQFHAFAGIGVWSYALQLAGWPDDIPVWTGSCPCQPFSVAGKRKGTDDERHLWPEWFRLIRECRPPIIFGEQVASPDGRNWLDAVSTDLEALGYAVGAADLCAAGVGAPHIRQRLFFVAITDRKRCNGINTLLRSTAKRSRDRTTTLPEAAWSSSASFWAGCEWIPCQDGKARALEPGTFPLAHGAPARVGRLRAYGNAIVPQVAATFIRATIDCGFI